MYSDLGRSGVFAAVLVAAAGLASPARADGPGGADAAARDALRYLGRLNRPDALEPAGSHGSLGLDVGAGAETYAAVPANPLLRTLMGGSTAPGAGTSAYAVPRAWLVKGLPMPVDVGLSVGAPAGSAFAQISAMVQWTVYEALAMPAASVRASYGRLFGLAGTALASAGAEGVVSYGLLRYITAYASAGAVQHQGRISVQQGGTLGYFLTSGQDGAAVSAAWTEPVRSVGVKLMVFPPFVALTGEAAMAGGLRDYAAKLSVEI